ncbi:Retrovirus-related Pol polyprotein from transposon TNT 1-94 [Trichinella zimbabwensis]|uniref:Retrovirus-related Pol polyprotein from transposon TNT 1-94 n=1 Tax=Trichinella zimbabwensis TaxID=268475 RepID=A0A0V1GVU3_9BILA|nr:Retrovirus-related Pol polyprotein from transposon TNT 1-94 [Trichinella zimbabwensis]
MPNHLSDYVLTAQTSFPSSFHEAMQSNSVWTLVDPSSGKKVLDSRWVLRIKTKGDGSIARYKARLVAKGYMQRPGIDYNETFSPVARFDTVRAHLGISPVERLKIQQFDVKTAFLYGALKEEVYVKQPEGFENGKNQVYKLNRSLYGFKQAPRCWNLRLMEFLRKRGLKHSTADPCLFVRLKERSKLLVTIYVDDAIVAGSDTDEMEQFLVVMKKEFQIKQGLLDTFLGMGIKTLDEANAVSTPAEISVSMEGNEGHISSEIPYREAVGDLMFLMTATTPNIAYAVSILSQVLDKLTIKAWQAVKSIFRYLRGTADYGLLYQAKLKDF